MNTIFRFFKKPFIPAFAFLLGCAYNTVEEPTADPCDQFLTASCDTTIQYSYAADIVPLMDENGCTGCHETATGETPKLNTYGSLSAYVTDCETRARFETSIKFQGNHPMPKGGPKMEDASINKFLNWICQGAKP